MWWLLGGSMPHNNHEIRDPIHVFVRLSSSERTVLDSKPFQRLRHIHQLGMTYLVYPGATHRRFEHSLGVMELASRVYDVVTSNLPLEVSRVFPELCDSREQPNWRCFLRMAALVHDIGHLPFSHAVEDMLPEDLSHEDITLRLIDLDEMKPIWENINIYPSRIQHLALGKELLHNELGLSPIEDILSQIIVGDAFGVDRMDYLLRDSLHTGVAYGKFDHFRLIDTLRILPMPQPDNDGDASRQFAMGVEEGGLQSAEALLLARYFMFSQVYYHPVRRIYDIHLKDFLKEWLQSGTYPIASDEFLRISDAEVMVAIRKADSDNGLPGHIHARRIMRREHFKLLYSRNPNDAELNPEAGTAVCTHLINHFGQEHVRHDRIRPKGSGPNFPVLLSNEDIVSSIAKSEVLQKLPVINIDYVFVSREIFSEAQSWLRQNREQIIRPHGEALTNG